MKQVFILGIIISLFIVGCANLDSNTNKVQLVQNIDFNWLVENPEKFEGKTIETEAFFTRKSLGGCRASDMGASCPNYPILKSTNLVGDDRIYLLSNNGNLETCTHIECEQITGMNYPKVYSVKGVIKQVDNEKFGIIVNSFLATGEEMTLEEIRSLQG